MHGTDRVLRGGTPKVVLTAYISLYPHLGLLGGGSMLRLGEGVRWVTGGTGGFFGWLILFGGVQCWVGLMDTKPLQAHCCTTSGKKSLTFGLKCAKIDSNRGWWVLTYQ